MNHGSNMLQLKRLGIDTSNEFVIYVHAGSSVCKSEGFETETQVKVTTNDQSITAILNIVKSNILKINEASLSESAWKHLGVQEGDHISLFHPTPVNSLKHVRSKIYGHTLNQNEFDEIITDIVLGRYSNIQLSSYITACAQDNLNLDEIVYLTQSMVKTGERLDLHYPQIMDKHCVGGIPGNRTTPIIVAIVASAGLIIPKLSSRSITSPAGTADTIETMTNVALDATAIKRVLDKEGGCMAWGGVLGLSPADDVIIKVERLLDIDPEGQMIASILSKKAAVGATHIVIDIPVGPTAKIRSEETFSRLEKYFTLIGQALGLTIYVVKSEGIQPLGKGIGPALEASDILAILKNEKNCSLELKNKAIQLAAILLEAGNKASIGHGTHMAKKMIENGLAFKKFLAICEAQGGFREPTTAAYTHDIVAKQAGIVSLIDNRNLSLVAKLAGAPHDPAAGIEFFAKHGTHIEKGQVLYRIHAEAKGELEYALNFAQSIPDIIKITG